MFSESLVINPGRLRILTALAGTRREEFVPLRNRTRLSDGNLAAHAKRLQSGGLIQIEKQFRDGKPVTSFTLTQTGRAALEEHARQLLEAVNPLVAAAVSPVVSGVSDPSEEWID
jgi:DNA-binding MarR family transcriptional regulator